MGIDIPRRSCQSVWCSVRSSACWQVSLGYVWSTRRCSCIEEGAPLPLAPPSCRKPDSDLALQLHLKLQTHMSHSLIGSPFSGRCSVPGPRLQFFPSHCLSVSLGPGRGLHCHHLSDWIRLRHKQQNKNVCAMQWLHINEGGHTNQLTVNYIVNYYCSFKVLERCLKNCTAFL